MDGTDHNNDDFLAAIDANPLDYELRKVYADWLEENGGNPDEIDRQRRWKEIVRDSYEWIERRAQAIGSPRYYYEDSDSVMDADRLIRIATRYHETDESFSMGSNEDYTDFGWEEFWTHWEIVTGKKAGEHSRHCFFRCGC